MAWIYNLGLNQRICRNANVDVQYILYTVQCITINIKRVSGPKMLFYTLLDFLKTVQRLSISTKGYYLQKSLIFNFIGKNNLKNKIKIELTFKKKFVCFSDSAHSTAALSWNLGLV